MENKIIMPKAPDKFRKKEHEEARAKANFIARSIKEKTKNLLSAENVSEGEILPGQEIDLENLKFPDELGIESRTPVPAKVTVSKPAEVKITKKPEDIKTSEQANIQKKKSSVVMPSAPAKFKSYPKKMFIDESKKEEIAMREPETEISAPEIEVQVSVPEIETPVSEISIEKPKTVSRKEKIMKIEEPVSEPKISLREEVPFEMDTRPRLIKLPDIKEHFKINIRYPLMSPYAFAHIFWDNKTKELVYFVEEPLLSKEESDLFNIVNLALQEMINVGFYKAKNTAFIFKYLQMNVQAILIELNVKITKATYQKIMYYIYRDFMGMNEIEPLLRDYYIEDIECNGHTYPIYIVHRKYGNMRTNISYVDPDVLSDFVEKLAQKTGRYVSFAQPLLDGSLPDGSRVNATYTTDITTRGPTFTIRKFTKEPWTPIHLMGFNTASSDVFAYLWMAIEYKFNVMVIGETGSGKTTFLNSILHFIPSEARICSVEDTRELNLIHDNWLPAVQRMGYGIPNILGEKYGEISMFDLLKESFRQNPDYMIVGEVRGAEAYVLFQGMASGHPSFGTFHAGSIESMIRRLETAPINLSSSLVETMDVICVVTHIKSPDKNIRRLRELEEIKDVKERMGEYDSNKLFSWDPVHDNLIYNNKSVVFEKIMKRVGITKIELEKEFKRRSALLSEMQKKNILDFKQFNYIINNYYKNPKAVLQEFGIKY